MEDKHIKSDLSVNLYKKYYRKYMDWVFWFNLLSLPYWCIYLDLEMILLQIFLFFFYKIAVTDFPMKKFIPFAYILYDILNFTITNQEVSENKFYFLFIGYFSDPCLKDKLIVKNYLINYHILVKISILIFKNLMKGENILNKFDKFAMKNVFFSMSIYFVIKAFSKIQNRSVIDGTKNEREKEKICLDIGIEEEEESKPIIRQNEIEDGKNNYLEENQKNTRKDRNIIISENNLTNILNYYPNGILIFKITKNSVTDKCQKNSIQVLFKNKKANDILNIREDSTDKDIIEQLSNFELVNERRATKYLNNGFYNNFYEYILKSPSKNDEIQQRTIKYYNEEKIIVTQFVKYIPEYLEEDSQNYNEYKIFSIENFTEEKKQVQYKLFKSLKSQFLLTISHELNNPLNGLIGFCEKLIFEKDINKKVKLIERIKKFLFSIKFFIKNLNLTSKIVLKEKLTMDPKNLNISHILLSAINKFRPFFDGKKIKYTINIKNSNSIVIFYDYYYFKFLLKNVLMYVCNQLEGNKIFRIESVISKDKKTIRLNFYKQDPKILSLFSSNCTIKPGEASFSEDMSIDKTVQTVEMLKDIINTLSTYLRIRITFSNIPTKPIISCEFDYDHIDDYNENYQDFVEFTPESSNQFFKNMDSVNRALIMSQVFEKSEEKNDSSRSVLVKDSKKEESSSIGNEVNVNVKDMDESGLHKIKKLSKRKSSNLNITHKNSDPSINSIEIPMNDNRIPPKSKFESSKLVKKDYFSPDSSDYLLERLAPKDKIKKESTFKRMSNKKKSKRKINISTRSPLLEGSKESILKDNTNYINQVVRNKEKSNSHRTKAQEKNVDRINTYQDYPNIVINSLINDEKKLVPFEYVNKSLISVNEIMNKRTCINCRNILIVDDEKFNLKTLKFMMKNFNVIPDTCENGAQAIEKVKQDMEKKCCDMRYKLILMDVMMPIMDGIEASRKIQELISMDKNYNLKIIILSAHDAQYIHEKFIGISIIQEFIPKPVKKSKIQELLNKYVLGNN